MPSSKYTLRLIIFIASCILVLAIFSYFTTDLNDLREKEIFFKIRLPRLLMGFIAGAVLSIAGLSFQTIFQNPLASPFTLGVASGASLGAAIIIKANIHFEIFGVSASFLGAFAGSLISVFFIVSMMRLKKTDRSYTMLLSGIAFSFFASSMILLLNYLGDITDSFKMARWTMGTLDVIDYAPVLRAMPFLIVSLGVVLYYYRELDIIIFGKDFAYSKGVDTEKIERIFFILISFSVGGIISVCGPIAFVGLIIPHLVKLIMKMRHIQLSIACVFAGGTFLSLCDILARMLLKTSQLPIGIITSSLGAPFLIFLLIKKSSK